jgi:hypothetical protein
MRRAGNDYEVNRVEKWSFQVQVMSVASDIETTQSILTSQATAEVRVCGLHLTEFTFIL